MIAEVSSFACTGSVKVAPHPVERKTEARITFPIENVEKIRCLKQKFPNRKNIFLRKGFQINPRKGVCHYRIA